MSIRSITSKWWWAEVRIINLVIINSSGNRLSWYLDMLIRRTHVVHNCLNIDIALNLDFYLTDEGWRWTWIICGGLLEGEWGHIRYLNHVDRHSAAGRLHWMMSVMTLRPIPKVKDGCAYLAVAIPNGVGVSTTLAPGVKLYSEFSWQVCIRFPTSIVSCDYKVQSLQNAGWTLSSLGWLVLSDSLRMLLTVGCKWL